MTRADHAAADERPTAADATAGDWSDALRASEQQFWREFGPAPLVVDDEAAIRDVAHRVLTSAGYRVVTAANGHEALGLLGDPQTAADLLLTDIVMPGMTAAAFAAQARAVCPGLPVLFMSGYEQYCAAGEGWPDPEAQVISKPFSRAALLARVTQMLAVDAGAGADEQRGPWT